MDKELVIKQRIVEHLKQEEETVRRHTNHETSEQYIRGFISGYASASNVELTHFFDRIIQEVKS